MGPVAECYVSKCKNLNKGVLGALLAEATLCLEKVAGVGGQCQSFLAADWWLQVVVI